MPLARLLLCLATRFAVHHRMQTGTFPAVIMSLGSSALSTHGQLVSSTVSAAGIIFMTIGILAETLVTGLVAGPLVEGTQAPAPGKSRSIASPSVLVVTAP